MLKLSSEQIAALQGERKQLVGELSRISLLLHGTYLERFSTCTRPGCACHSGKRHGPRAYIVVTRNKTQHQIYVPCRQVEPVRAGITQYHRLLEIVDRITSINLELMRGGALQ